MPAFRPLFIAAPLLLASLTGHAASNPQYTDNLAKIYTGIQQVDFERAACRQQLPAAAKGIDTAYAGWKRDNQPLLSEYDKRYDRYLRALPDGNKPAKYQQYRKIMADKFASQRMAWQAALAQLPKAQRDSRCQNFPAALQGDLDPARRYGKEISANRKLMPLA
ncbi:hypothetical protein IGB42_03534 [Andreprevotia sp. IGB-42]|uniref:hypothetical protein n=1 Tax=Andreprevotia sp. IGB-42 TaxID=2497473 RepID=UPI00135B09B7|nr:hypothetical protein [Andreprevotia sp. IGB-42]KAF0811992.1 hypothetical protein IGB42_03534 [Andreprevotia sp. IGB-42]